MRKLFFCMLANVNLVFRQAYFQTPVHADFFPNVELLFPVFWIDEVFDFHLLEFARAEKEIAWGDLIAESFADLSHAKRQFWMEGVHDILEIDKHALSCFRTEI